MANTDSMPPETPMAWPIWGLFTDTGGIALPNIFNNASNSTLLPILVEVLRALTASISPGGMPAGNKLSDMKCHRVGIGGNKMILVGGTGRSDDSKIIGKAVGLCNSLMTIMMHAAPSD
jgi:hypothetical protein